jgi:hypothetical protein
MGDLSNSTRTLHKATYVPIETTEREARVLQSGAVPGRAFQKLNLLRILSPTSEELKQLRPARRTGRRRGTDERQARAISALLRANDANRRSPLEAAQAIARVDTTDVIQIAERLIEARHRKARVVVDTLEVIRRRMMDAPVNVRSKAVSPIPVEEVASLSGPTLIAWAAVNDKRLLQPLMSAGLSNEITSLPLQFSAQGSAISLFDDLALDEIEKAVSGFKQSLRIEPIGRLYLERMEMYPVSIERGELVGTVPLSPQETVTISHKEWSTSSEEFESIVQDFFEHYSEKGVAEKSDASMASESETRHSNSFSFGASVSGGFGGVTVSTSLGLNETSDARESLRRSVANSREITQRASARTRKEHKVTFKLEAKKGTSDESFRTITNPSPTNAMRIDYFRLMRKWRTDLYRYGLRMTYDIVIPNPGAALWGRYQELEDIERKLSEPLEFPTKLADITEKTWADLAAQYGAKVEPPPAAKVQLVIPRELKEPNGALASLEFVAPPGYSLDSEVAVQGSFLIAGGGANLGIHFSGEPLLAIEPGGTVSGGGNFTAKITSALLGDDRSALFVGYASGQQIGINAFAGASLLPSTLEAWRVRTFVALQEGALQMHLAKAEKLRDRRQQLLDEISRFDALTLRRMEREEIIRGTLQWLFGPQFQLSPPAIATVIDSILSNASSATVSAGELEKLTAAEWSNVLSFGEFVKFLHQAVEWENVLFLLYPYFWGSSKLAKEKRFFLHPDPLHRDFLRAGFVRVVLTIRPGYEQSFTQLLETGAFATLPNSHPYMTIASEIEAYARTNFPGIPPANSEQNARPLLYPQQRETWEDMQRVIEKLETFRKNNDKYPEKLSELGGGPFTDFWGNEYGYRMPGISGEYDLVSFGADGQPGGNELNSDISAAAEASLVARWFDFTPTSGIDIQLNSGFAQIA